ncbi:MULTISPECIES: hypothetical protein [Sinorhizobium]|uniref:Uncharacterized protein n=2 Tax=Sinorhizobium TaxID=28105 RepID=A0A2S3YRK1_9HYPH|nr:MULTISPECIES: hypothetical protein [Sinorhizobium]ASY60180.1 hypothetical protein SS05631_b60880 [Sinorhizobium sp. CCBAU 05631]AUX80375.1 hypothetical protein NXT3_PC01221 [Sinorhizobium fredii]PDT43266.1 hypothetical protein CO656_00775 [Sinorhizobium sp. FG01]PDT52812.1 hypothetical protein CO664_10650 [Sinorhizobium sp. NG07B]POH28985.1 hypothetical protein ATY30_15155 [Sinorhizobium americanum]
MSKHGKARSPTVARPLDPHGVDEPIDASERHAAETSGTVRQQITDLQERIAELEAEIDAIATEAHTAIGTLPGADRIETAKDVVTEKRDEIQRLRARLEEIQRLVATR